MKRNRFIMFQQLIEGLRRAPSFASIISRIVRFVDFPMCDRNDRDLPVVISYDLIGITVFDTTLNVPQGFDFAADRHCKFHKIFCLGAWVDLIYDKRGFSMPAFKTQAKIQPGFRMYRCGSDA